MSCSKNLYLYFFLVEDRSRNLRKCDFDFALDLENVNKIR